MGLDMDLGDATRQPMQVDPTGRTSSTRGAAFNVFATVVGVGLLQVSYGAARMGWFSVGVLVVMGAMSWYTAVVLIRCISLAQEVRDVMKTQKVEAQKVETYGDVGEIAFGPWGKVFVELQVHLSLLLLACIFNLLGGLNLAQIAPDSWEWLTPQVGAMIIAGLSWFHVFLKTLGEVAAVSAVNLVITLTLAAVVMVESVRHPPELPAVRSLMEDDVMSIGMGIASFCAAYGVHPVLPSVYRSMVRPQDYERMIKSTFILVFIVTLPVLVVGYYVYGTAVHSPIYETPALSGSPWVKVMIALITIHLVGTYAIVLNPPEKIVESLLNVDNQKLPLLWRICVRSAFVLVTVLVSLLMGSRFPPLMELAMALTNTFTLYIFPVVFYTRLRSMVGKPLPVAEQLWVCFIACVALFALVFGTIGAIRDLQGSE